MMAGLAAANQNWIWLRGVARTSGLSSMAPSHFPTGQARHPSWRSAFPFRRVAHGTIRVLIVDDQRLMGRGLRTILELERDLEIVAEAEDGEAALQAV